MFHAYLIIEFSGVSEVPPTLFPPCGFSDTLSELRAGCRLLLKKGKGEKGGMAIIVGS